MMTFNLELLHISFLENICLQLVSNSYCESVSKEQSGNHLSRVILFFLTDAASLGMFKYES